MRYSIEPRERRYVKGYGFSSLAINIGRNLSNNMIESLLILLKNLQQMHQKTAKATVDLVGNKIVN